MFFKARIKELAFGEGLQLDVGIGVGLVYRSNIGPRIQPYGSKIKMLENIYSLEYFHETYLTST